MGKRTYGAFVPSPKLKLGVSTEEFFHEKVIAAKATVIEKVGVCTSGSLWQSHSCALVFLTSTAQTAFTLS